MNLQVDCDELKTCSIYLRLAHTATEQKKSNRTHSTAVARHNNECKLARLLARAQTAHFHHTTKTLPVMSISPV